MVKVNVVSVLPGKHGAVAYYGHIFSHGNMLGIENTLVRN